jgi:hypothetical protein
MADPTGAARRREGRDGTIVDLSSYDSSGLLVCFRVLPGVIEFVALVAWE